MDPLAPRHIVSHGNYVSADTCVACDADWPGDRVSGRVGPPMRTARLEPATVSGPVSWVEHMLRAPTSAALNEPVIEGWLKASGERADRLGATSNNRSYDT